ncbi:MAG: TonB-dependent receptor [Balneolales bacterium]
MKTILQTVLTLSVVLMLVFLTSDAHAQQISVSGTVTIQGTDEPLPGVNIVVKGTTTGTSTGMNGEYEITVPEGSILVFTAVGFELKEVEVDNRTSINVGLVESLSLLDEMVVIGYGEQARATLTTSVSKMDTLALQSIPFTNVASALQGTLAGVRVQSTSGQPGAAPQIILRGGTSINNPNGASPLYIVDGVKRNNLNDINSSNIESIQVLKDAASTAIYGARGSNGVIIVETKSGSPGTVRIQYRSSIKSSQQRSLYSLGSAQDYIYFNRLGLAATGEKHPEYLSRLGLPTGSGIGNDMTNNTGFTPQYLNSQNEHKLNEGWASMQDPIDPTQTILYQDIDWQDVLFQNALTHDHYISASGGSETATYRVGLGYLNSEGITIRTGYERLNLDLGGDVQIRDNLRINGVAAFSNSSNEQVYNTHEIFQRSLGLPPTAKFRYEDGTLAPGQNRSMGNPLYHLDRVQNQNNLNRLTLGVNGVWEIISNLTFEPSASLYAVQGIDNNFQMSYWNSPTQFIDSRNASGSHSLFWQREVEGVFTYVESSLENHNFQANAGFSYFDRKNYSLSASGRGAASDNIPTLNATSEPTSVTSNASHLVIAGYFARINYDYQQKYLFSATTRYDGASNLGAENRWALFPGVSFGWNLQQENFWTVMPEMISSFKLRTSYGANGNISGLTDFHAHGAYSVGSRYNEQSAIMNNRLPNSSLRWEQSKTLDIGFDLGLFDDRATLLFDFYRRVTEDLLTDMQLPHSTGFQSILTNLGSLENRGIEVEVQADVIRGREEFAWTLGANAALNQNKIMQLPENDNENNRIGGVFVYDPDLDDYAWKGGLQEGGRLGDLYAYKQVGIYATDEEAAAGPTDMLVAGNDKTKFGGDVNWLDVDENGIIDTHDQIYAGNIFPDWTGGISNNFSYRNINLLIRTDFAVGHTIYHETRARLAGQFQGDISISQEVVDHSWQEQGDVTDVPRYYWADQLAQNNLWRGNTRYYEKADYLAIREVTLSYRLPSNWLSPIGFRNVQLNATGNNLHYFTNFAGLTPEVGGTDTGRYPLPRSFIFGINVEI